MMCCGFILWANKGPRQMFREFLVETVLRPFYPKIIQTVGLPVLKHTINMFSVMMEHQTRWVNGAYDVFW